MTHIVAIDGHDGVGKTTIAQMVCERYGLEYRKPFSDSLGKLIAFLYENAEFDGADVVARLAVRKVVAELPKGISALCDRHWLSLFSVLPEEMFSRWEPLPPTVLLTADSRVVFQRLHARDGEIGSKEEHEYFLQKYVELAKRFGIPIIDTTSLSVDETVLAVAHALRL